MLIVVPATSFVPGFAFANATAPRRLQSLADAVHALAAAVSSVRSTVIVGPAADAGSPVLMRTAPATIVQVTAATSERARTRWFIGISCLRVRHDPTACPQYARMS